MSTHGSGIRHVIPPTVQADAVLSQANPVSGTKYTVLNTTKNVRIVAIEVHVTWTVQPTPLEIHGTIDGVTFKWSQDNPVSGTPYYVIITPYYANNDMKLTTTEPSARSFLLEAKSVKIEAETTGGTVSALDARVKYAKW